MSPKAAAHKDLVLTRVLNAPRELVFKCWTDPVYFAKWWGLTNWTNPSCELDARSGGKIRVLMRSPDGEEHMILGAFNEIVPPHRVVLTIMEGEAGNPGLEVMLTVTLAEDDSRTKLTMRVRVLKATAEHLAGMDAGWNQSLDRLAATTAAGTRGVSHDTFRLEREFKAPVSMVYRAWTSKEAKGRWFVGPDGWDRGDYEMDFRVGGRETLSGGPPGHPRHYFDAVYQNIVPDQRIIYTYSMRLGETPISVSLATIEFSKTAAGTRLVLTEQGAFLDGFDGVTGRERGTNDLMNNLEAELKRLTAVT